MKERKIKIIKIADEARDVNTEVFFKLLRTVDTTTPDTMHESSKNSKFFIKLSNGWTLNSPEELDYQFNWLIEARRVMEFLVPKPLVMIEIDGKQGYIMERINGNTIESMLIKNPNAVIKDKNSILDQLTWAVLCLHNNNLTHNDLALNNILLDSSGNVILIDPLSDNVPLDIMVKNDLDGIKEVRKCFAELKQ